MLIMSYASNPTSICESALARDGRRLGNQVSKTHHTSKDNNHNNGMYIYIYIYMIIIVTILYYV